MSQEHPASTNTSILTWIIPNQILILDLAKDPDADLNFYDARIVEHLDAAGQPVDIIMQFGNMPTHGFPSIKDVLGFKHLIHPYLKRLVFVSARIRPVGRFIISALGRVKGLTVRVFDNLPEALYYIESANA